MTWASSSSSSSSVGDDGRRVSASASTARNCDAVVRTLERLDVVNSSASDLPQHKIFVSDLEICNNRDMSCCTRRLEQTLQVAAVKTSHAALSSSTAYLSQFLTDNHLLYQGQFLGMLRVAENNTQDVLKTFYKIDQKDWKSCLDELFIDLSMFLQNQKGDVMESLVKFYNQLFPVIFQHVLNDPSVVELDLAYRECLMEIRQDLSPQPFGDAPLRLGHGLAESLRAAQMLLSTLDLGAEMMNITAAYPFEKQCSHALTRLEYCSLCEGISGARSCRPFCQNVMHGCFSGLLSLQRAWDKVLKHLQVLGSSMRGSRDMEEVLSTFPMRVSESIMHSMETAHKYYDKIISQCGHPKTFESQNVSLYTQPSHHRLPSFPQKMPGHRPSLHSKVEIMLRNVIASKGFLGNLPDALCNSDRYPVDNCWNGTAMELYKRRVPASGLAAQVAENPEMSVHITQNPVVSNLVKKLNHMHQRLVSVVGDDEEMQSDAASYRFEGSGSYQHRKNDDDGLSDDEDINVGGGSGSGDYEEDHDRPPKEKYRHQQKGYAENDDFAFAGATTRRPMSPYITKSNQQPRSPNAGSRWSPNALLFLCNSLILFLLTSWSS